VHKNYKVHTENSADFNLGEKVIIEECRPKVKKKLGK